jgi:LETM1-like protein
VEVESAGTAAVTDVRGESVVSVRDDAKIARLRAEIGKLESRLSDASKEREGLLRKEDQLGKLIRAREIRAMDDNVSAVRRTLAVRVMQLETENIYVSLNEEIERSGFEVMDQRVMVAEFGDIDERLESLAVFLDTDEPTLIDDEEVGILANDIQDLKMRLGLDTPLYSSRIDGIMVRQAISSSIVKAKAGVDFYTRGLKLFGGDCMYAARLFRRVFVGYTLSPREVRTLRRAGRDLLTLIPFTIILIAPLTPIGHVLIFGFIQRYWPDFFPSTFTERRQSLMRRHEALAKSIQEGETDPSLRVAAGDAATEEGPGKGLEGLGILRRFGLAARAADEQISGPGAGAGRSSAPVDSIAATSSDLLSTLADDAPAEAVDGATRVRRGGSRVVLDDLHLAD